MSRDVLEHFATSCALLMAAALLALVTVIVLSLAVKLGVEYLTWLTTWRFIG